MDGIQEPLHLAFGNVGFDFQPHRRTFAQIADLIFDGFEQIDGFFFVNVEVAIARDAEGPGALKLESREEPVDEQLNDLAEEGEALAICEAENTRQDARDGYDCPA